MAAAGSVLDKLFEAAANWPTPPSDTTTMIVPGPAL
jgi:hypothetical protein